MNQNQKLTKFTLTSVCFSKTLKERMVVVTHPIQSSTLRRICTVPVSYTGINFPEFPSPHSSILHEPQETPPGKIQTVQKQCLFSLWEGQRAGQGAATAQGGCSPDWDRLQLNPLRLQYCLISSKRILDSVFAFLAYWKKPPAAPVGHPVTEARGLEMIGDPCLSILCSQSPCFPTLHQCQPSLAAYTLTSTAPPKHSIMSSHSC